MKDGPKHHFFESPAALRAWLEANHREAAELHVGYFKRHAIGEATPSLTWAESVAEALCFGWIDGIRRTIDEDRYVIRFTPRRPGSKWSAVNVCLMAELEAANKLTDAGRAAFEARKASELIGYRAQKKDATLDEARLAEFRGQEAAWAFFEAQPPGYRREAAWWVMQAKREETRDRRLARLIELSAARKRLL